jgi:LysM repeat protein
MACAGVIAAVPATHDLTSAKQATVTAHVVLAHLDAAVSPAHTGYVSGSSTASAGSASTQASRTYSVRNGDTLSSISKRYYNAAADWPWLYHENSSTLQDPNVIDTGQRLNVPADPPSNATSMSWYQPKHAAPSDSSQASSSSGTTATETSASGGAGASGLSGTLGCSALEQLWQSAGGNPADAALAASIAMAESGGNQYATGTVGEEGYWQINPVNGDATYDPVGNAQAAVNLSANGANWSAWTTYTTGAYTGKC